MTWRVLTFNVHSVPAKIFRKMKPTTILRFRFRALIWLSVLLLCAPVLRAADFTYIVGVAKVDVTPDYPVRLNGYLARNGESDGILQHIYAKALAIGNDKEGPAVLISLDNCILPGYLRGELLGRLAKRKITSDKFAIAVSHTHSAPKLTGAADNIFGKDIPAAEQAHIDRYTRELIDKLEQVVISALKNREPSILSWGKTTATFAANRRTKGGPVDHDVPLLRVTDKSGKKVRALLVNYACHCTTLGAEPNQICGDWAGYTQEFLERGFPGTIAMTIVGCGADSNPAPRGTVDLVKQHGQSIATAVQELLSKNLTPLHGKLEGRTKQISLPFDTMPTRQEFEAKAADTNAHFAIAYHARKQLARLDRGEKLQSELPYLVQTWNFGDELALVFLPGEVVVDYSLRLKKEFDAARLWVNGYANDVPCYIPSKRVWREGGYEGGGAMIYYDRPTRLAENAEELIISAVHDLMPKTFLLDEKKAALEQHKLEYPDPKSPEKALKSFHTKPGFTVGLVANEPQIVDPVAIDFSTDGKLWVLEMRDYPSGMDGNFKVPGGRVKLLEDRNGDGKFERATVFLDKLSFPTGLMQWRKGVLICAAPDIFYAEDTNGDGKADVVKKLFTGFATHNFQARVNSLRWGLDNWVYGSGGLFGGKIHSEITGKDIECSGRDFRFNPDTGELESSSGVSQQGRVRDDFGNWFGCNNSVLLLHFPLPEKYLRRNLHVTSPEPGIALGQDADPNLLFPASRTLERFNVPNSANRTTSACGVESYRDELLGKSFYGNSFSGEPVHNLVHRYEVKNDGITFVAHRPEDEKKSEFLASTDNWFRPVETRTGPDGALWVVDMYRFVIEHPKWIPAERLAKLDVRAGEDKGRIFRVYPKEIKLRSVPNLARMKTAQLVAAMETGNGTERDLVHRELFQRADRAAVEPLMKLVQATKNPGVKIQTLSALEGLKGLTTEVVVSALRDSSEPVREQALRLSEPFLRSRNNQVGEAVLKLTKDSAVRIQFQLALSLGEWNDARAGAALGNLLKTHSADPWFRAAILSSASYFPGEILQAVLPLPPQTTGRDEAINALVATAASSENSAVFESTLIAIAPQKNQPLASWQLAALASLQEALHRKNLSVGAFEKSGNEKVRTAAQAIGESMNTADQIAQDAQASLADRQAAIRLLTWSSHEKQLHALIALSTQTENPKLQKSAQDVLRLQRNPKVPELLMSGWNGYPVSVRSSILEILLSRDEGIEKIFEAVERGLIQPAQVPMGHRQLLLKHANKKIRERSAVLFPQNQDRAKVVARFSEVAKLIGNPDNGAAVFARACANCHAFRGQGVGVGPDLMALGDKSPQDFLVAILDPSAVVEPRFVQYNIDTKDGRSISGVIQAETSSSVTLVQGGGVREKILRSDIEQMKASGLSLMPEGLEEGTSAQDFADLISYLKARPAAFGAATPGQTDEARKKFKAGGANGFATLISASEKMDYPSWLGNQPLAFCRQNDGKGKVNWASAPAPEGIRTNEFYEFRLAAALGYLSDAMGKFTLSINGKTAVNFAVTLTDAIWKSIDGRVSMHYQVMENNAEDSNGVLTISVRGDLLKAGEPLNFEVAGSAANSQRWFGICLWPETKSAKLK